MSQRHGMVGGMRDPEEVQRQLRRIRSAAYAAVAAGATLDDVYAAARAGVNELEASRLALSGQAPAAPTQRPASEPVTGDAAFEAFRRPGQVA